MESNFNNPLTPDSPEGTPAAETATAEPPPAAEATISAGFARFRTCRWQQPAEAGVQEFCTHREVKPYAGTNNFDADAWCPDCVHYKLRRVPEEAIAGRLFVLTRRSHFSVLSSLFVFRFGSAFGVRGSKFWMLGSACLVFLQANLDGQRGVQPPAVDHHQHLFSPALAELMSPPWPQPPMNPITAADLVGHLDAAGIERAVVLSTAYIWSQPSRRVENDYERVRADNDWTSHQVSLFPDRLIGLCGIDPLKDWAEAELRRCSGDPHLRRGVKMHIGNSTADYRNATHVERLRRTFRVTNDLRMPIVVHMRASITFSLPYGREEAQIFLDHVVAAAPDVPIQIAHLAGAGGYTDPAVEDALAVFADAITKGDPRTKNLWFDVTGVAMNPLPRMRAQLLVQRIRQLGIARILYGSDAPVVRNTPAEAWAAFRRLPLTPDELRTIATNVAPYVN